MIRKVKLEDAVAIQRLNAECLGYDSIGERRKLN